MLLRLEHGQVRVHRQARLRLVAQRAPVHELVRRVDRIHGRGVVAEHPLERGLVHPRDRGRHHVRAHVHDLGLAHAYVPAHDHVLVPRLDGVRVPDDADLTGGRVHGDASVLFMLVSLFCPETRALLPSFL